MAVLSMAEIRALPKSAFAVPSKAPGPGSYPMPDAAHARNALSRAAQHGSPAVQSKVKHKVRRLFSKIDAK